MSLAGGRAIPAGACRGAQGGREQAAGEHCGRHSLCVLAMASWLCCQRSLTFLVWDLMRCTLHVYSRQREAAGAQVRAEPAHPWHRVLQAPWLGVGECRAVWCVTPPQLCAR